MTVGLSTHQSLLGGEVSPLGDRNLARVSNSMPRNIMIVAEPSIFSLATGTPSNWHNHSACSNAFCCIN